MRVVLFFLVSLVALCVVFRERGLNDPGTLWHTRVGQIILDRGFMTTDPFTFTFEGKTWIPQQWLGEVFMAMLYRINGFDAVLFGYLAVFAAAFTAVFRRLLAGGMGWPLAGAVTAFAMVAAGFHFYARPHVFTITLMVLVTAFLVDFDNRRCTWKHLLWLIPIHIVWTNLHGGMLGGVATFGLAIAGWIFSFVLKRESPVASWKQAALLLALVAVCGLTMFVNPIGFELQKTWFRLIGSKTLAEYIPEHSPLNVSRGGDLAVLAFSAIYFLVLVGARNFKPLWFIPLIWLALSVSSIRNGPLFVAVAAVMIADIWPHTVWYRKLLVGGDTLATPTTDLPRVPWLILSLIVIAGFYFRGWSHFEPKYVPVDMIDAVRNIPSGERIYNDPNFGGFLIWNAPDCKIFMDDRFELCGDDWLREYVENPQFDGWQKQYGFRWAFVGNDALADHPQWKLVQRGQTASLYQLR